MRLFSPSAVFVYLCVWVAQCSVYVGLTVLFCLQVPEKEKEPPPQVKETRPAAPKEGTRLLVRFTQDIRERVHS